MSDFSKGSPIAPASASPAIVGTPTQLRDLLGRSIELMKPVTWFAPAWAFLCGAVASGGLDWSVNTLGRLALGLLMAGPILCGLSQVVNDYCVDNSTRVMRSQAK